MLMKPQTGGGHTSPAPERKGNASTCWTVIRMRTLREEIENGCIDAGVGDSVPSENGGKTGQVRRAKQSGRSGSERSLGSGTQTIEGSDPDDWTQSPGMVIVGLIDPIFWPRSRTNEKPDPGVHFTNFVRSSSCPMTAGTDRQHHVRFIGSRLAEPAGPTGGPLVKVLQLIE